MTATVNLRRALLRGAADHRLGIVEPAEMLPATEADIEGVFHAAVPVADHSAWRGVAGGCAEDPDAAVDAAIGEALERYAALMHPVTDAPASCEVRGFEAFSLFSDAQRTAPDFPHSELLTSPCRLVEMQRLSDGRHIAAPAALVLFRPGLEGGLATSSGLAAGESVVMATLRAVQELIERDALMCAWLHGLSGRHVQMDPRRTQPVARRGGSVALVDITPRHSAHPVALVGGGIPIQGRMRYSAGAACRATWAEAVQKAYLEWAQGLVYVGHRLRRGLPELRSAGAVRTFEDHAIWYTVHPEQWGDLPMFRDGEERAAPADRPRPTRRAELWDLVEQAATHGVELLARELTTTDRRQAGVSVVRVLSPQLTPIHCDERWPYLGGRSRDVQWRYPNAVAATPFPSPFPHPLG